MSMCTKLAILTLVLTLFLTFATSRARQPYKDSPIRTIVLPYQPNAVGYTYQKFLKAMATESRRVHVPTVIDMVPNFNLRQGAMSLGSNSKGAPINFADGAYPVYYMPGNANGMFNGKIRLLE